jgi:hypothetical protein
MALNPFVEPLRGADSFHKNAYLMFHDTVADIRERTLSTIVTDRHGPDSSYWLNNENSEHKHLFIFECAGQYRFIQMLVKTDEGLLRGRGTQYKAVCAKLELDPIVPLVLIYGLFRPRSVARFISEANWLRRKWANNTVLLELPDDMKLADPNSYEWGQPLRVQSAIGTDSQFCEDATVCLRRLTEIHDQKAIGLIVDELLRLPG